MRRFNLTSDLAKQTKSKPTLRQVHVEDFSEGILKSIDHSKTQHANGYKVDRNILTYDSDQLNRSWQSIYHERVKTGFRFMDTSTSLDGKFKLDKPVENKPHCHRYQHHHQLKGSKYGHDFKLPFIHKKTAKSKEIKYLKFDWSKRDQKLIDSKQLKMPSVNVTINGVSRNDTITYDDLRHVFRNKTKAVKLHPDDVDRLNLNPAFAKDAKENYFHPTLFSFNPINFDYYKYL